MLSRKSLTAFLTLCACSWVVSGCGGQERLKPIFPPPADLRIETKPIPGPEIVTSAQAAADYDIALELWGERGWQAVRRICQWAADNGAAVTCVSQ